MSAKDQPPLPDLIATGTTQQTATQAYGSVVVVLSVAAGAGIIMPMDYKSRRVYNRGANTLSVYPPSGGQWEALGVNQPAGVDTNNGSATFHMVTAKQGYIS